MKQSMLILAFSVISLFGYAQKSNYQLSSHILDVSQGTPAVGVAIKLEKYNATTKVWTFIEEKNTDQNGRITDFLSDTNSNVGIFRLTYFTQPYFKKLGVESFYPFIEVVFEIKDTQHYHVPITLSAFGYATYRGN